MAISYHARIAGTQSKLRAYRDGWRILVMIVFQSLRLRPIRPILRGSCPAPCLVFSFPRIRGRGRLGVMVLWGLLLIDLKARRSAWGAHL